MVVLGSGFSRKSTITCGLRSGPRKSLWRSRVLSTESIQAVQSLKLARSTDKLEEVFSSRVSRLLKEDLIATLTELQRQNEWELALKVFEFVRNELWYKPDLSLYSDMIYMFGKNKLIETAEDLFFKLKKEGLKPDTRTCTEMIGAFLQVGMVEKAMETYRSMKESGCAPDKLTLTILIRNLEKAGEEELASTVKKDCEEYVDSPEKFLEEVGRKYVLFEYPLVPGVVCSPSHTTG
ncbi:Pentatricopeptide repeat [Macleaya cordata]|uniref:Pentatricopeptide repeat n=1 Tax=Macleaya cordata TaxID=56857 RepID=A0A200QEC7_MACCD|nr:Pentatricopeptide repeat [Macleaya cordata]